uniref:Uncharacterized protein n=1 Tax=Tanacetum cinerariifolium TaxID=118510 RepID=A0A6L2M4J5_TANCI|nr:hypothetical protein [Tanacetum cinerariifolium]
MDEKVELQYRLRWLSQGSISNVPQSMVDASLELYPVPYSMLKPLCLLEPKKKAGRLGSYAKPVHKSYISPFRYYKCFLYSFGTNFRLITETISHSRDGRDSSRDWYQKRFLNTINDVLEWEVVDTGLCVKKAMKEIHMCLLASKDCWLLTCGIKELCKQYGKPIMFYTLLKQRKSSRKPIMFYTLLKQRKSSSIVCTRRSSQSTIQALVMKSLTLQNANQPRVPLTNPYQQYIGLPQTHMPQLQVSAKYLRRRQDAIMFFQLHGGAPTTNFSLRHAFGGFLDSQILAVAPKTDLQKCVRILLRTFETTVDATQAYDEALRLMCKARA